MRNPDSLGNTGSHERDTEEMCRQVPLAEGQSQQQGVNGESVLGGVEQGGGGKGTGLQGRKKHPEPDPGHCLRSRANRRDGEADRKEEKMVGGGTGRSAWDAGRTDGALEATHRNIFTTLMEMGWRPKREAIAANRRARAQGESSRRLSAEGTGTRLGSGGCRRES